MVLFYGRVTGLITTDTYVYDDANRLTSVDGVTYTWDDNGNLLNDGVNTYTYDSANRLKTMTSASVNASYAYNGLGDRLQETLNGVPTTFTMDLNPSTSLRAGSGLTQALSDGTNTYLYGNGRIAQTQGGVTEYFLGDALGSVRQLTDTSGAITYASAYDPYGVTTQTYGASQTAYGFTGEYTSNDMVYLRSRWYDPASGRFTTQDSWQGDYNRPLSLNRWMYVEGNPINLSDPSGFGPWEGTQIHIMIENHYRAYYGGGRNIETNWYVPSASKNGTGNWGFIDIADLTLRQIYEIKPIEYDLQGEQELYWYLAHLPPSWGPGTIYSYRDIYIGPWPNNPNKDVYAAMHIPGVIAYWGENKRPDLRMVPVPNLSYEQERSRQQNRSLVLQPIRCQIDPQTGRAIVNTTVGTVSIFTIIWYLGKLLSPTCGPAAPVCAVVL